ncbi:MAG: hypothetical protein Q4C57_11820 [Bacillota bacterium]|nr:hypothetical protein [Bacillota bacterium]
MKMNEKLYKLATADVKEMLRACNELPQYLERMRALEEIISECENEKAEAYNQYDSKVFHLHGRADKQELDGITDDCEREIIQCKLEKNEIRQIILNTFKRTIEMCEKTSSEKMEIETSEDILVIMVTIITVVADLMGMWNDEEVIASAIEKRLFAVVEGEQENAFFSIPPYSAVAGGDGGTAFIRERGHDAIPIEKREPLESRIRRAELEIKKMNSEGKKREKKRNDDKGWDR